VTSMLSPLMSRTRSTMPSMIPHTRGASPLGGRSPSAPLWLVECGRSWDDGAAHDREDRHGPLSLVLRAARACLADSSRRTDPDFEPDTVLLLPHRPAVRPAGPLNTITRL
jgi:hypothetical protein